MFINNPICERSGQNVQKLSTLSLFYVSFDIECFLHLRTMPEKRVGHAVARRPKRTRVQAAEKSRSPGPAV